MKLMMKKNSMMMKKNAKRGEKLLSQYDTILHRNFANLGDYSLAKRLLGQLADLFEEVGTKDSLAMAKRVRDEKNAIDQELEDALAQYGIEI